MHRPLQVGYAGGWAPLRIGSHYAVRIQALKEIGLGSELAEDHPLVALATGEHFANVTYLDFVAHYLPKRCCC